MGRPAIINRPMRLDGDDATRARTAARSLSTVWGARILRSTREGVRNDDFAPRDLALVSESLEPSVLRTVVTETADAWNDERVDMASGLNAYADIIEQEWNAVMDGVTCVRCRGLDGQRAPLGDTFDGLTAPIHSFCRCFIEFVMKRIPIAA